MSAVRGKYFLLVFIASVIWHSWLDPAREKLASTPLIINGATG